MDLLWPGFLALLALIPLFIFLYIRALRRRRRFTVRYSSLSLVREAMPKYSRLRRHLPFALFLIAIASLVVAAGRPVAAVSLPSDQKVIVLSMDVSFSMCSGDIAPNRLIAAEAAAIKFVEGQRANAQIGLVAFSGFAELVQPPTRDLEKLKKAISSLLTGRRTAIGSGILEAIDTIAEIDKTVAPAVTEYSSNVEPEPVLPGTFAPDIIVLLTDGASNAGPLPLEAAKQAANRGIRVYTIGFGTAFGGEFVQCGQQFRGREQGFGGGFGGGGGGQGRGGFRRGIDEETLKEIAKMTGGEYYSAESANELVDVFNNLPTNLITRRETTEISVFFAAFGALLTAMAIVLSQLWHPLP
jgi:Ca-activated chloride channel homolog